MNFLGVPLGYAIYYIYKVVPNYALSIIIFTLLLRVVLIPFSIKQQKSLARTSAFQPYINEINKKYAKNLVKKNEELRKLYSDHNINPASGCLIAFLPMVVLFGMIDVLYRPLLHILHLLQIVVASAVEIFKNSSSFQGGHNIGNAMQLNVISDVINNQDRYSSLGPDVIESIKTIDLNFLGFNIGEVAKISSITIIFPILALIFSFLQLYISFKTNSMPTANNGTNPTLKVMMFVMPILSIWISLTVPIGVSLYWIVGYILQILQILILNKVCNVNKLREQAIEELEEMKKKNRGKNKNVEIKGEEKIVIRDKDRLNAARKRLAEKYDD